jgi:hypothetical protein
VRALLKEITISWVFLAGLTYAAHVTGWPAMLRAPEWIISYGNQRYSLDYNLNLVIKLEAGRGEAGRADAGCRKIVEHFSCINQLGDL